MEKRALDLCLSILFAIALLPIMAVMSLCIFIMDTGPVLFCQERIGLGGKLFRFVKFRTMNQKKDELGNLLPDGDRITIIGSLLRKYSLDELPQLWLVICGKMSMVGPRPLLPRYFNFFNENETVRFSVLPGITGLAQICGRNLVSWDERLSCDIEYVNEWSFVMDLLIIKKSILNVIKSKDVAIDANQIMEDLDVERSKSRLGDL